MIFDLLCKLGQLLSVIRYDVDRDAVPNPFLNIVKVDKKPDIDFDSDNSDTKLVRWGDSDRPRRHAFVDVNVSDNGTGVIEYTLTDEATKMSMPDELTWADKVVIEQHDIRKSHYLMVRPHVINGSTNAEIAKAIGKSKSWVERISPKVRDAVRMYQQTPAPIR